MPTACTIFYRYCTVGTLEYAFTCVRHTYPELWRRMHRPVGHWVRLRSPGSEGASTVPSMRRSRPAKLPVGAERHRATAATAERRPKILGLCGRVAAAAAAWRHGEVSVSTSGCRLRVSCVAPTSDPDTAAPRLTPASTEAGSHAGVDGCLGQAGIEWKKQWFLR